MNNMNGQNQEIDVLLVIQEQINNNIQLLQVLRRRRRRRRRAPRAERGMWVRPWIGRRFELGLYDRLMVELRNEDPRSFHNFMRMPPAMYDEIVERLTPRITRETTNW